MSPKRVDANQAQIVHALRQCGCTVQSLASIGKGCPDLLVGCRGDLYLMELKDGAKSPSKRRLTDYESEWIADWEGGPVYIVESIEDALRAVGVA
jgi:Holliday junction resolvase